MPPDDPALSQQVREFAQHMQTNMSARPLWPGWEKLMEAAQMSAWGPPGIGPLVSGYRSVYPKAWEALMNAYKEIWKDYESYGGPYPFSQVEMTHPALRAPAINEGPIQHSGHLFTTYPAKIREALIRQQLRQQLGPDFEGWIRQYGRPRSD